MTSKPKKSSAPKIRWIAERKRAGGNSVWVVNPPQDVRLAINADYSQHDTYEDAVAESLRLGSDWDKYRSGKKLHATPNGITCRELVDRHRKKAVWKRLKPSSQQALKDRQELALRTQLNGRPLADWPVQLIGYEEADLIVDKIGDTVSYHRSYMVMSALRRVWYSSLRDKSLGVLVNPWARMDMKEPESRKVIWTPEQFNKALKTADKLGYRGVGTLMMLCYDMCQRPGDMRKLRWEDLDEEGFLTFEQEKTGTPIEAPISPRLEKRLMPKGTERPKPWMPLVVDDKTGRAFTSDLYNTRLKQIRAEAELPEDLAMSDFRRSGCTELGDAGATEDELRAISGHQDRDVLKTYVKSTRKQALNAAKKRFKK